MTHPGSGQAAVSGVSGADRRWHASGAGQPRSGRIYAGCFPTGRLAHHDLQTSRAAPATSNGASRWMLSASFSAIAEPMPRLAPVTITPPFAGQS